MQDESSDIINVLQEMTINKITLIYDQNDFIILSDTLRGSDGT